VHNPDAASSSNFQPTDVVGVASTEQGGDMHAMLSNAFDMHEVREPNREPEGVDKVGVENVTKEHVEVALRSTTTCLKWQISHFMGY
jgi:hypothetical protein